MLKYIITGILILCIIYIIIKIIKNNMAKEDQPIIDIRPGHYIKKTSLGAGEAHSEMIRVTGPDPQREGYWLISKRDGYNNQISLPDFEIIRSYTRMETFRSQEEMNEANSRPPLNIGDLDGIPDDFDSRPKPTTQPQPTPSPTTTTIPQPQPQPQPQSQPQSNPAPQSSTFSLESQLIERCRVNEPLTLDLTFHLITNIDIPRVTESAKLLGFEAEPLAQAIIEAIMPALKESLKRKCVDVISNRDKFDTVTQAPLPQPMTPVKEPVSKDEVQSIIDSSLQNFYDKLSSIQPQPNPTPTPTPTPTQAQPQPISTPNTAPIETPSGTSPFEQEVDEFIKTIDDRINQYNK